MILPHSYVTYFSYYVPKKRTKCNRVLPCRIDSIHWRVGLPIEITAARASRFSPLWRWQVASGNEAWSFPGRGRRGGRSGDKFLGIVTPPLPTLGKEEARRLVSAVGGVHAAIERVACSREHRRIIVPAAREGYCAWKLWGETVRVCTLFWKCSGSFLNLLKSCKFIIRLPYVQLSQNLSHLYRTIYSIPSLSSFVDSIYIISLIEIN